jgi:serine/threonine-protein kinase
MFLEPREVALGRELRKREIVSDDALRRCAADVQRLRASGQPADLARLLAERGLVKVEELEATGLVPDARSLAPPPADAAPARIGPYELRRLLGEGGMGVVHEAWDPALRRTIALKTLRRGKKGEQQVERFRREGRALATLRHPNIVAIHAFGESADVLYLAMDLVEGPSLAALQAERQLPPPRELAVIAAKVARALDAAHREGIVHRDVKPGNIVLDAHGEPRLVDFGIAVALDEEENRLTRAGDIVGTPVYLAPEQIVGAPVTARTDIYALGVVLYELISGRVPHGPEGTPGDLLYRIVSADPLPLTGASPDMASIVMKALEKEPDDRYPTAEALALDLEAFARGDPIAARPQRALSRLFRHVRRRSARLAALALALAAVGGGIAWVRARERSAIDEGRREAERPFEAALERGRAAEARGAAVQALAAYQVCLVLRGSDPHARAGLGRALSDLGSFINAEESLRQGIAGLTTASSAEQAATLAAYARAIADRLSIIGASDAARESALARDAAHRARVLAPGDALVAATEARVEATFAPGDATRALLDRLHGAGDAAAEAALARALLAFGAGEHDTAATAVRGALAGPPRARVLAGWILASCGEADAGLAVLAAETERQPENGTLRVVRARALARRLDFPHALEELHAAEAAKVNDPDLSRRLARARGDDPTLESARDRLDRAWSLLERGTPDAIAEALRLAREGAASRGDIPLDEVARVLGKALNANGHTDEALAALEAGLAQAPRSPDLRHERLPILMATGRWEAALEDARALLELGTDRAALRSRPEALLRLGRVDEAVEAGDDLARALPDEAGPIRVGVRMEAGRYEDAIAVGPATPQAAAFLGIARRLVLPPLGEALAPDEPSKDWGDGFPARWESDPGIEAVAVHPERDPRRRLFGHTSERVSVRGARQAVFAVVSEAFFDVSHARSLVFFVRAERLEEPRALDEPVSLAVVLEAGPEKRVGFSLADAPLRGPGWHRIAVPLGAPAGAWVSLDTGPATPPDRARITAISFAVDGLPASGALLWIDGLTPVE